jgi:hypothetical protein
MLRPLFRTLAYLWASPYTLIGLAIGGLGLCTGGRGRLRDGVYEFSGGATSWCVYHLLPGGEHVLAFTLGHTVLGRSEAALDLAHEHEMVHVRQYERWGPLMAPLYLGWSAVLWFQGKRPYRDNPFEIEAYGDSPGN